MRAISIFLVLVMVLVMQAFPQQANKSSAEKGNTYAVIVGISSYESDGITRLDFAHKDAKEFEKFLRTSAGGAVPEENIRLLLNKEATYTAIYNALYWLLETCNKNDLVYFYFSGHGDIESNTIYKLGFLLAANTPRSNYINNAVRIEDLNNIANTLSVEKGAKVVLITDACHSGKLAGTDNRGNFLVGDQLRTVKGNEIRITSCGPDQLSNEDERWGGGRGVFSYYLVKGLTGMADYSKDNEVSLAEIKKYLNASLLADRILAEKEHKQTPVINGPEDIRLSTVADNAFVSMQSNDATQEGDDAPPSLTPLGLSPQGYLFSLIGNRNIEELVDFNKIKDLSKEEIPFSFISMLSVPVSKTNEVDSAKISRLIKSISSNKDALKRFNEKLVELMADRGQQIINLYLEGDEAELERRRYYNSLKSGYDVYPIMFAVAMKLVSPQSQLYHILQVKYQYFSGVTARVKIPLVDNPVVLQDIALKHQLAAMKLDENAAYIHNELGILYRMKKEFENAEKHFLRATQISPTWALPWSNLGGLYASLNKFEKGIASIEEARKLQPGFQGAFTNLGSLYEKKGNLLLAEEFLHKSARLNSRHYLPFERLGFVYLKTTRYAEADSNFLEADRRKRGFRFPIPDVDMDGVVDQFDVDPPSPACTFDTTTVKQNDIIGNFYLGLLYVQGQKFDKAENKFRQVIKIDSTNPLAFHYLGKLLYDQQRWKEADIILSYAVQYHLDEKHFASYCDSLKKLFPQYDIGQKATAKVTVYSCVFDRFRFSWVEKKITRFFLGTAYEKWNHFEEAEKQFRAIIKEDSSETGAYNKLWTLLEKTKRYYDAEAAVRSYPDKNTVTKELFALYRRIIQEHPDKGEWYYKAGVLMYNMVLAEPGNYLRDRKYIKDDSDEEVYRDNEEYMEQQFKNSEIPGTGEGYYLFYDIFFPLTEGIRYLRTADSLLSQADILAEINYKTGDLYIWQGLPQRAGRYYKKSVELKPDDANTRIKYVNTNAITYNFGTALEQMDSLYNRGEINYTTQVLMATYCIYAGRFDVAGKLLTEAKQIHPYIMPGLTELNGRLQFVSNNPSLAIPFYREYLDFQQDDYNVMYTIARLYAKMGNAPEAFKWLKNSIDKGFNYYWVLKMDESWSKYSTNKKWKELAARVLPTE